MLCAPQQADVLNPLIVYLDHGCFWTEAKPYPPTGNNKTKLEDGQMKETENVKVDFCQDGLLQKRLLCGHDSRRFIQDNQKWRSLVLLLTVIFLLAFSLPLPSLAYDQELVGRLENEVASLRENITKWADAKEKPVLLLKTGEFSGALKIVINGDAGKKGIFQLNVLLGEIKALGNSFDPPPDSNMLNDFKQSLVQIGVMVGKLSDDTWDSSNDTTKLIYVLLGSISLILILAVLAFWSRHRIFNEAADKDRIAEIAMKQTFGLPIGTVRGIMALLVSLLFILSLFLGADIMNDIPEVIKIIVSLVFGFYFAKSTDQSKDLMDAMLGKGKQQAVKRQEALLAIQSARKADAETLAPDLYAEAQNEFSAGEQQTNPSEAISSFNNAIKKAQEAKAAAIGKNKETFNALADETEKRIYDLAELKIDYRAVKEIYATSKAQYERGNFQDAAKTLERVKSMVDVLLEEYDEAQKIYEEKLTEAQRQKLSEARKNIDDAHSLGVGGAELISGLISTMGVLKEKGDHLVDLFKKRVQGIDFEPADVMDIFNHLKLSGDQKKLNNLVDIAINSVGKDVAAPLRDLLKGDFLEKVVLADAGQLDDIISKDIRERDIPESVFRLVVGKIRKNLVDLIISDDVKKGLPEDLPFDTFKNAMTQSQEDTDGKGVLSAVTKALEIGETILSFTPYGGIAKIAGAVGRGLFKIFGK